MGFLQDADHAIRDAQHKKALEDRAKAKAEEEAKQAAETEAKRHEEAKKEGMI